MEPMSRRLGLLLIMPFICVVVGMKQMPSLETLQEMTPPDRERVTMDQAIPRANVATRELRGINDPKHDAAKKKLLQTLNERRTYVVDSDREIQAIRLQRYEADREKDKARRLDARRGKRQKKKGARKQNQARISKEKRKQMKELRKKYTEYFRQQEMAKLADEHRGEQSEGYYDGPTIYRLKRSAELPDSLSEDSPIIEDTNTEGEVPHVRKKRLAFTIVESLWPYGKVPYVFDDEYPDEWKYEVLAAMKIYEDLTPIRFLPHSSEVVAEVGHSNKLEFESVQPKSCWSYIGYLGMERQNISCYQCGIATCGHEIGHALGLEHEHQSTLRNTVEEIKYENIPPNLRFNFDMVEGEGHDTFDRMDLDSLMHYQLNIMFPSWTLNYQPQIVLYDEDLKEIVEWSFDETFLFYSLKDITEYYKQIPSLANLCPSGPVCSNDGYLLKFRDETCKCICPQGLNHNCDQVEQDDQALKTASWPLGFALLKPPDGCPPGFHEDGFTEFKSTYVYAEPDWPGEPTQYVWGPYGNTSSDDFWQMRLDFCVRDDTTFPNVQDFGPGDYCIIKDGVCPPGFSQEGSWKFRDAAGSASSGGHFPSGTYSGQVVVIDFCCRLDGWMSVDLELPSDQPFILFPNAMKACQTVKGMQAELYAFYFDNKIDGYEPEGDHAHAYKFQGIPLFAFFACYYTPLTYDSCGSTITLDENTPLVDFQTPNYPNLYPVNTRCTWIFQSPENTKMILEFTDFDIQVGVDGNADDSVEIRHNLPGNQGLLYYGDQMSRSWVTYQNYLGVYFFSNAADTKTGFNGVVRMITDADMCYTGKGENYDGTRSYTRKFKKCIPWAEAKKYDCQHSPYDAGDINDNLEENYCRNPGSRDRPWCYYIDDDGCLAEFCDVCNLENCYDFHIDCDEAAYKDEFCVSHFEECEKYCAVCDINDPSCVDIATDCETRGSLCLSDEASFCAETCGECAARIIEVQDYPLACDPPVQLPDAEPYEQAAEYPRGATVSFTCSINPSLPPVTQTCSTTGNWIPKLKYACGYEYVCNGSSTYSFEMDTEAGKLCYELLDNSLFNYAEAKNECINQGGTLAMEKDSETTQALNSNIPFSYKYWLGLDDIENESIFTWADGESLQYHNWAPATSGSSEEPFSYKPRWNGKNTFYASVTWSKTLGGTDCVPWSSRSESYVVDENFPVDGSVEAAGSNCRDPSKSGYLWCFTTGGWDRCDLAKHAPTQCIESPQQGDSDEYTEYTISQYKKENHPKLSQIFIYGICSKGPKNEFEAAMVNEPSVFEPLKFDCEIAEGKAYNGTRYFYYHGTVNQTVEGKTCARWDAQTRYSDSWFYEDGYNRTNAENYCRFLAYHKAWCYVDSSTYEYGFCDVPNYCGGDGYSRTVDYVGTISFIHYGFGCLRWDVAVQYPSGTWLNNVEFPDGSLSAAENYCRGFSNYDRPWCYYQHYGGVLYWDYCAVPLEEEQQDCVLRENGVWHDAFCDEKHYAVCEKPPSVQRTVCEDQHDDCAEQFENDPTLCTEYTNWADIWCAKTCGSCSASNPNQPNTDTCPTPQDTGNFQIESIPPTLTVGLFVEYKCIAEHAVQSGNLLRGCTIDGTLSGSPPVCVPIADMELWNNDLSMRERYNLQSSEAIYIGDNALMRIEKDGQVVAWRLYSMAPGELELYVFRRVTQTSSFTVVGKTVVAPIADKRKKTIELHPEERFQVEEGDVIGWGFFSSYPGGIPYDRCKVEVSSGGNIYKLTSSPLSVNETKAFSLIYSQDVDATCHVYSLAVKVGPVPSGP